MLDLGMIEALGHINGWYLSRELEFQTAAALLGQ
jgi:hypothetical protein